MDLFSRRPAIPLVAGNLAGVALIAGSPVVAILAIAAWLADFAWRFIRQRALTA
jgi:flagellar biosynthesis component FlhA